MVRRRLLAELLHRRERRRREHPLCRVGGLYGRRRHRHGYGILPLHLPRQHLVQGDQTPDGDHDLRLFADRAADARRRRAQQAQFGDPRPFGARHPPRLVRRRSRGGFGRNARHGSEQHHAARRLLQLLLQRYGRDDQAVEREHQPRMDDRGRPARRGPVLEPQPPFAQPLLREEQPHDRHQHPAHERGLHGDQPHGLPDLPELEENLRRSSQHRRGGRLRLHEGQEQQHRRARAGGGIGQDSDAERRDLQHHQLPDQHADRRGADLLLRACQLQLPREIPAVVHHARRRFVEIRRGQPLGLLPGGFGRLDRGRGGVLAAEQGGQLAQTEGQLRSDGQQRHRALRHLRQLQFGVSVQRHVHHHDRRNAEQQPDMGIHDAGQCRSGHGAGRRPGARGFRLLRQGDPQPAVRRDAAQHHRLRLGGLQRGQGPLLRRRSGDFVGQHQPRRLHVDHRLHL